MKSSEFLNEETMSTKVNNIVDALNDEISKTVQNGMTKKRLTAFLLKYPKGVRLAPLTNKSPGMRVWTRGDRTRYKEPGYIKVGDGNLQYFGRQFATFKRLFPTEQALLDHVWETLKNTPGSKDLGTVTGEFGSSQSHPALRAVGLLWIKRPHGIEYGSMSRLTNKNSVWRHTPPEDNNDETS